MHQHPRPSPKPASPASSPNVNLARTHNHREREEEVSRASSERGTPSEQGFNMGEDSDAIMRGQEGGGLGKEQLGKLSQVIQVRYH